MDTIKINRKSVKMVAHRGLSGLERENTNAAFIAAGNRSYYGMETDVHRTADGEFVVIHDETTKRVANVDFNVEENKFEDSKNIILPDLDGSYIRSDLRVPSLKEYISICKKYDKKCILEIKNRFETQHIKDMIDLIRELDYLDSVIFISFNKDNVTDVRKLLPEQPVQWLLGELNDEELAVLTEYNIDVDLLRTSVTQEVVDIIHKNNLKINCWVSNDPEEAEKLVEMGVDFITTDILE